MVNSIEFKGLGHSPVGNALLKLDNDVLEVSNLSDNLDGLKIETGGASELSLNLKPIPIETETVVGTTLNIFDDASRVRTVAQWAMIQCPEERIVRVIVNSKLEGKIIELSGTREGAPIFKKTYEVSGKIPGGWVIIANFKLSETAPVLSCIDYRKDNRQQSEEVNQTTITKTIGVAGKVSPCKALSNDSQFPGSKYYEIDRLHISSSYSHAITTHENRSDISQLILTAKSEVPLEFVDAAYSL